VRFILIDRILELESGKRARAIKNVSMTEDFLAFHFPDTPIMPGALMAEAAVQLAGWIIREATGFQKSGLPIEFDRAKFHELVRPGDQLELVVEVEQMGEETASFTAQMTCRGKRAASGRFVLKLVPTEDLEAIEDAKRMFNVLSTSLSARARS
jgi:3-hydroxymyristoyl/3-hydroxydecanoyl-(acyl carrier protein) dehydratase